MNMKTKLKLKSITKIKIVNVIKKFISTRITLHVLCLLIVNKNLFLFYPYMLVVQLRHLKYLSLRRCPNIDDWCLDRFVQFRDSLKVLDLSECPLITHRGLACLSRLTCVFCFVVFQSAF